MRWGVLGPLLVADDAGTDIRVPAGRLQILLAVLLMRANQPVPLDEIVEVLWEGTPPAAAARTVRVYVARLRQVLGPDVGARVLTRGRGYACQVDEDEFDLLRFETLCRQARSASRERSWSRAADLLSDALGLWRGAPLADIPSEPLRTRECPRLDHLRQQAIEDDIDVRMNLDQHQQLIPQLRELTDDQPLREHLHAQLMRALARSGRRAEALEAYRRAHRALADQLGIQPGPELRELHQHILAGTEEQQPVPDDKPGQPARPRATSEFVVPHQLPAAPGHFTGRRTELDALVGLLKSADGAGGTVVISAIDGMAGIGKTALAVHAAHQLADQFPDGVLFNDLHGFTPDTEPTPPEQALDRLLRGLGVPGPQIPSDLEARVGLYRSVLARRRVLIVLDNAADETQLTPLLPASVGCAAIVTSRRRLAGLDDATHLTLPLLDSTEAADLLRSLVGNRAVPADQPVIERIVTRCGRLPLAIRITAARLRLAPAATPATLCAELEQALETGQGLDWLSDGHRTVTAVLAVSLRHLMPGQQRALRLVGLHPGRDLEPYALAALADTTLDQARHLLEGLHAASLLDQPAHRRYTVHDLVAAYARQLAAGLAENERRGALDRLYDHYAACTSRAMDLIRPWEADRRPPPPVRHGPRPDLADRDQAQAWLHTEIDNLLATAHQAITGQRADHTLHQSATLHWHLAAGGHFAKAAQLHLAALRHTRATANPAAEQDALNRLGRIRHLQGRYASAGDCFERALAIARRIADRGGEQDALCGLGDVYRLQGSYGPATEHFERVLAIAHQTGQRTSEQDALTGLGHIHYLQGRYGPAGDCFERALVMARQIGNLGGELRALRGLGNVHYIQVRPGAAAECYERALDIARRTGNIGGEQDALYGLGCVHRGQGRYGLAAEHFERVLAIARKTGQRTSEQDALTGLGHVHRLQGRYESASEYYEQTLTIARQTGNREVEQDVLRSLGIVHYKQGRHELATDCYERALTIACQTGNRNTQFEAHHGLGRVDRAMHHYPDALRHHQAALHLALDSEQPADQARAHDGLAHAHHALGNRGQAHYHWQTALDLIAGIGTDGTYDPDVTTATVRARLDTLDNSSTPE